LRVFFALLDPNPLTRLNPNPIRIRNPDQNPIFSSIQNSAYVFYWSYVITQFLPSNVCWCCWGQSDSDLYMVMYILQLLAVCRKILTLTCFIFSAIGSRICLCWRGHPWTESRLYLLFKSLMLAGVESSEMSIKSTYPHLTCYAFPVVYGRIFCQSKKPNLDLVQLIMKCCFSQNLFALVRSIHVQSWH
jgi:hypothetical protein